MVAGEIYEDAKAVLGYNNQDKILSRISDAVETLANKGLWEPLLAYLNIRVQNGYYVILPNSVETPLRVNIDDNPSFARTRMYEFTMNGPATNSRRVDWTWEDLGDNATVNPDDGSVTRATGRTIRLSAQATSVRMLVRLATIRITALTDFIPIDSKLAILLQLKAIESYKRGTPADFQLGQAQEAQALKFLQEEQQSRTAFIEIAKQMDAPRIRGYEYHSNNVVLVSDIFDDASDICGPIGEQKIYDRITEATEVLANKAQWDNLTLYMDIAPNTDIFGLPYQVETPIAITINKKPTLARSRMFEFSVNGPGGDLSEVTTVTWEDQGEGPLILPIRTPMPISVGGSSADEGKAITVTGIDSNDHLVTHDYLIPANAQQMSAPIVWKSIERITKPVTQSPVSIFGNYVLIGILFPDQTEARNRMIKTNIPVTEGKVMYRKALGRFTGPEQMIPLKSRTALLLMLRALTLLKQPQLSADAINGAAALEAQALKFMQEEEQSRLAYQAAASKNIMPAYGINTDSRDVILAGDVYDDACDIFGPIGYQRVFDKITDAHEMLCNKSQWDGLDGYVDIVTDNRGYATLPRHVEVPIAVNYWRHPTQFRNKWYEFHMNGMGTDPVQGYYADDLGEYPLINEPSVAIKLFCKTEWEADGTAKVRAYGYNNVGQWIVSEENGSIVDGELVPMNVVVPNEALNPQVLQTTNNQFRQVTRITKDVTNLKVEIWGRNSTLERPEFLGLFEAADTEPMYRRIRIPTWVAWMRMRFRVRQRKITKMSDPLWMKSKTAIVTMMRALKALDAGDANGYAAMEATAVKLISEEQMSRNPDATFDLQYDQGTCFADPLQGQY